MVNRIKNLVSCCIVLLMAFSIIENCTLPAAAAGETSITLQLQTLCSVSDISYSIEYSLEPIDSAPIPSRQKFFTKDESIDSFSLSFSQSGVYEYRVTPVVVSGDVHFVDGQPRIIRLFVEGTEISVKVYQDAKPRSMLDLIWHVEPNQKNPIGPSSDQSGNQKPNTPSQKPNTPVQKPNTPSQNPNAPAQKPSLNPDTAAALRYSAMEYLKFSMICLICLIFLAFCIRSSISRRKSDQD